jgi:hypothetical protein
MEKMIGILLLGFFLALLLFLLIFFMGVGRTGANASNLEGASSPVF